MDFVCVYRNNRKWSKHHHPNNSRISKHITYSQIILIDALGSSRRRNVCIMMFLYISNTTEQ